MAYEFKYALGQDIGHGYIVRGHCRFYETSGAEKPMYWIGPLTADGMDKTVFFFANADCVDIIVPQGGDPAECSGCPPPMIPPC